MHPPGRPKTVLHLLIVSAAILQLQTGVDAGVTRIEIRERLPFADGRSFEGIGPYRRLLGRVHFAVDPKLAANRAVIDLELAPTNGDGRVEFRADLEILAPVDLGKSNGTLLYGDGAVSTPVSPAQKSSAQSNFVAAASSSAR